MQGIEPDEATETDQSEDHSDGDLDAALAVGDDAHVDDAGDTEAPEEPPSGFERWRRDSALGAVGTGVARGLQAVFAPPVNEPAIVASVPGDPPGEDERIRVILDPDDPAKSVAIVPERPAGPPPPECGLSGER